jgi:Mrp family chromosome partitioning ATPase
MPAELLGSREFDELLQTLKQNYNLIILDSPPALLVTDASEIAGRVDVTVAVIRAGVTTGTVLGRVSEVLERSGSRAVGFVLNGVDTNSIEFYEAFGHNGAGKYYEENNV